MTERELIAKLTGAAFLMRAEKVRALLRKANFNPNQPRLPRGHPHGGRWVDDDGGDQGDWPLPLLLVNDD